jgi:hypothetical protein
MLRGTRTVPVSRRKQFPNELNVIWVTAA